MPQILPALRSCTAPDTQRISPSGLAMTCRFIRAGGACHSRTAGLRQTTGQRATDALRGIPEVIEIHATTGDTDLVLKVVARDTADFHCIADALLAMPDIVRFSTVISTKEEMPLRLRALLENRTTRGTGPEEASLTDPTSIWPVRRAAW
jgi:DNA-binding Lrp family transcriptional regulator